MDVKPSRDNFVVPIFSENKQKMGVSLKAKISKRVISKRLLLYALPRLHLQNVSRQRNFEKIFILPVQGYFLSKLSRNMLLPIAIRSKENGLSIIFL